MSGKGNCYDNSMVETFFKSLKAELIWRNRIKETDSRPIAGGIHSGRSNTDRAFASNLDHPLRSVQVFRNQHRSYSVQNSPMRGDVVGRQGNEGFSACKSN
jgi:transposase InsO family protein